MDRITTILLAGIMTLGLAGAPAWAQDSGGGSGGSSGSGSSGSDSSSGSNASSSGSGSSGSAGGGISEDNAQDNECANNPAAASSPACQENQGTSQTPAQ